jgi:hypothetical protein
MDKKSTGSQLFSTHRMWPNKNATEPNFSNTFQTQRRRLDSRALLLYIRLHALIQISCGWCVLSSLFDGGVNSEEQVSREVLPVVQVRQVLHKLLHMPNIGKIFVFIIIWASTLLTGDALLHV